MYIHGSTEYPYPRQHGVFRRLHQGSGLYLPLSRCNVMSETRRWRVDKEPQTAVIRAQLPCRRGRRHFSLQ